MRERERYIQQMLKVKPATKLLAFYKGLADDYGNGLELPILDARLAVDESERLR
jgi:hypothetical protein